ncbi:hypothetical protein AOQ73_06930 [Bradyrhizobium pachyrhizi]|nr:hypothetical protein AOQ73_06930 [Bradyrhizobium pachyrhizi]OMI14637.1 hypothetical protein BSN85_04295 [Bradyrhizobium brasilense]
MDGLRFATYVQAKKHDQREMLAKLEGLVTSTGLCGRRYFEDHQDSQLGDLTSEHEIKEKLL